LLRRARKCRTAYIEKSQIQTLDRTQPGLPMKKGRAGTKTHNRKPKPFIWTPDPDRIIEKLDRGIKCWRRTTRPSSFAVRGDSR
jgi:hypothetical protein